MNWSQETQEVPLLYALVPCQWCSGKHERNTQQIVLGDGDRPIVIRYDVCCTACKQAYVNYVIGKMQVRQALIETIKIQELKIIELNGLVSKWQNMARKMLGTARSSSRKEAHAALEKHTGELLKAKGD